MVQLARPRSGHFDLGTGYHGDLWLDLDALLLRPSLLRAPVRWLAARLQEHSVDAVCGPLEGGAFLAQCREVNSCGLLSSGFGDRAPYFLTTPIAYRTHGLQVANELLGVDEQQHTLRLAYPFRG